MKLLTIAIPTYNRESVLRGHFQQDKYVTSTYDFFISSNGKLKEPSYFTSKGIRVNEFSNNMGAAKNFEFLLSNSNSKYVMLLSDEDFINFNELPMFLETLKSADENLGFIKAGLRWQHEMGNAKPELRGRYDLNRFLRKGLPLRTYMSGFVFNQAILNDMNLPQIMEQRYDNEFHTNVYPQNNLVLKILEKGYQICGYERPLVTKGKEAGSGGDSHSHGATGLNPLIYSQAARERQLAYQLRFNDELTVDRKMRTLLNLHTKVFYYRAIVRAKLAEFEDVNLVSKNCLKKYIAVLYLNFVYLILRIVNKLIVL